MAKLIKKYSKIAFVFGLTITLTMFYLLTPAAQAGVLTSKEVRLTDSRLSQTGVDYDFKATQATAQTIACIEMYFCTTASGSCTPVPGMDATSADKGDTGDWNNLTYANWDIASSSESFARATTTDGNAEVLGTAGSWIVGNVTNSNATSSYYARITTYSDANCTVSVDTGVVAFAVLGGVTVTATVAETLNVAINASTCDTFLTAGTDIESATTSIAFGTINANTFYNSCQRIDIGTNAVNGYVARIHKTQSLTYGGDTIADGDCDGACSTSTAAVWQSTVDGSSGFGYCMKDRTLNAAEVADANWVAYPCGSVAGDQYFKTIDNESVDGIAIMQSGSATSTNSSWIGYRLNVPSNQAAGTYTTTIVYVVTPNY